MKQFLEKSSYAVSILAIIFGAYGAALWSFFKTDANAQTIAEVKAKQDGSYDKIAEIQRDVAVIKAKLEQMFPTQRRAE